jgi:hypothetical protein
VSRRRLIAAGGILALLVGAGASAGGSGVTLTGRQLVLPAAISPQFQPLALSGTVASGRAEEDVTIQINECTFPGWRDSFTTHTDAGGVFNTHAGALVEATFRARWKGSVSPGVTVQTRPGVRLEVNGRNKWAVGVLAQRSFLDRRVQLQRFDRAKARWQTVRTFRLTKKFRIGVSSWTYGYTRYRAVRGSQLRAYVPRSQAKPCYLAGFSIIFVVQ